MSESQTVSVEQALEIARGLEADSPAEALDIYSRILAVDPDNHTLLTKVGSLAEEINRPSVAIDSYRRARAIQPDKIATTLALAQLLADRDIDAAIEMLASAKPRNFFEQSEILSEQLLLEEWRARAARGLPLHHVLDMAEVPFAFTSIEPFDALTAAWCAAEPKNAKALMRRIWALALMKNYDAANAAARHLTEINPDDPKSWIRFGEIPAVEAIQLPTVHAIKPGPHEEAIYISCDTHYFEWFGLPLLRSLEATSPGLAVHVHLIGDSASPLRKTDMLKLKVSSTHEDPREFLKQRKLNPNIYFNAIRLVRFCEHVRNTGQALWLIDADAMANSDPRRLFGRGDDFACRVRAGRIETQNQFSACLIKGTDRALPYLENVSRIICGAIDRLWWGIDQFAMLSAYIAAPPQHMSLLGPREAGIGEFESDAAFWFIGGKQKAQVVSGLAYQGESQSLKRYAEAFALYNRQS